ncbi:PREDICTED: S-type anion channel SLAH3-like [Nicotiana attenuata]|uniref:S-type anion channel SLAH3-like n=1 Tax=Nicotiana attenuata TaxID=49451 RepID=UPI0009048174|nr:PREDICTED: S-type anion channel SLAH3-like [Nicotiana attenuata]
MDPVPSSASHGNLDEQIAQLMQCKPLSKQELCNIDTSDFAATSTITGTRHNKKVKFYSQPMPRNTAFPEAPAIGKLPSYSDFPSMNPKSIKQRDPRFNSFKIWSGKLERQLTNLSGKNLEAQQESNTAERENIPVHQYFDALEGPELDTLRYENTNILNQDGNVGDKKWPFLLRFPISSFGICLGVSSQAIMRKALATSPSSKFLHVSFNMNLVLRCISVALNAIVAFIYGLKIIFYFEAVRREYPIRVKFFFAPWIALLFLALGVPPSVTKNLHTSLWYILMTPIF